MKHLTHIAALALTTCAGTAFGQSYTTGLSSFEVPDAQRPLEAMLWYPSTQTEGVQRHHTNAVWSGIDAVQDGIPADGQHPLVVLSHGMYGNTMTLSWMASELAQRGYVVAAVNHPGTSTWARDPDDARRLWQRPQDITRTLDHILATPSLSAHVDADRIYMAGHSLGGYTAVALAGGRYDAPGFEAFCAQHPGELVCGIFDTWNVGKTDADRTQMAQDLSDPRIKGFGVFDLGGTQTFSAESLGAIDTPMLVIGAPLDIAGLDLNVESRALVAQLPETVTYLEPASLSHFDFMGECKDGAIALLEKEEPGDEVVCMGGQDDRRGDHAMIIAALTEFLDAH